MARPRYKSGKKKGKFMSNRAIAAQKAARKRKRKKTATKPKKRGRRKVARKKRRRRSRRKTNPVANGKQKAEILLSTAAYGYLKEQTDFGPQMTGLLSKVPGADAIGVDAVAAIALHYLAKNVKMGRKYTDAASTGLCGAIGLKLGQSGFDSIKGGWSNLAGDPDEDLVGELDPADFIPELDPEDLVE